jgi:hypothetical protein
VQLSLIERTLRGKSCTYRLDASLRGFDPAWGAPIEFLGQRRQPNYLLPE